MSHSIAHTLAETAITALLEEHLKALDCFSGTGMFKPGPVQEEAFLQMHGCMDRCAALLHGAKFFIAPPLTDATSEVWRVRSTFRTVMHNIASMMASIGMPRG